MLEGLGGLVERAEGFGGVSVREQPRVRGLPAHLKQLRGVPEAAAIAGESRFPFLFIFKQSGRKGNIEA